MEKEAQIDRVYKALKKAGKHVMTTSQLIRIYYKFGSRLSDLNKELVGEHVTATRIYFKNGRFSHWLYQLTPTDEKLSARDGMVYEKAPTRPTSRFMQKSLRLFGRR